MRENWVMTTDKVIQLISIYCPSCGHNFSHEKKVVGKTVGFVGGAALGAKFGAGVGLVGGPLGAIAGTVPGAILGAVFGSKLGGAVTETNPSCPKCGTDFKMPG